MTFGEALVNISKTKQLLRNKMKVKLSAADIKPNGRLNKYIRDDFLKQADIIKDNIKHLIYLESKLKSYISKDYLIINRDLDDKMDNEVTELILIAKKIK